MKKVIIFDLDGTLLDTLDDLRMSVNFALSQFNYPLRTRENVRKDIGNGVSKLIERSISAGILDENYAKCLEIFQDSYRKKYNIYTRGYNGCFELLSELKHEGYIVTVATNKIIDVAKELLDTNFPGIFDFIQGDQPGVKKKPDSNMIDNIAKHYQVNRNEVLYIGDTNVDEETALNSHVDYALVTYGYRTKEEIKKMCQCTILLDTPEEVYQYIKSL